VNYEEPSRSISQVFPIFALLLVLPLARVSYAGPRDAGHVAHMDYLDNGVIRVGVDLNLGGAIVYLSPSPRTGAERNVINSWDWGRQVQMSYYSGPVPFVVDGKHPAPNWAGLGWNPIQAGDDFGHGSKTVEHTNDGKTLYVKCVPMQWPLDNVPGECTFESWLTLNGPVVQARCRLNNDRSDHIQYPGCTQELPAVYTNGPYYKLMTYAGDKPFANEALTRIEHRLGENGVPWAGWTATENWAALVGDDDWGVGVYNPGCYAFSGGFAGNPGAGGEHEGPTGYIAPNRVEVLDHDIRHEYSYELILGPLDDIRRHVYQVAARPGPPGWRFTDDRQGWSYVNAVDTGWPTKGELKVLLERDDPQMTGPRSFWQAADAPTLRIDAALHSSKKAAQVFWATLAEPKFNQERCLSFDMTPDNEFHNYEVRLSGSPAYKGAITQLRFDPIPSGAKGDWVRVKSISFVRSDERSPAR
jgi:hypothetical protein